ncbi:MAG: leucine-rich repeat protein [Methanolobus sp.]|nr:leucine-rich repeat protein [Methanolobus sp.]
MTRNIPIFGKTGFKLAIAILIIAMLVPTNALAISSNTFDSGIMTIEEFTTGSLGDTVTATHGALGEITTLRITAGTLSSTDVYWIRENLISLETFEVIETGAFEDNTLPNNAFYAAGVAHANITTVNLTTVTEIGSNSFTICPSLQSINMPLAVTIGNSAFIDCPNLTDVNLPEATTIDDNAFKGCSSLENISLPKATSFGYNVFQQCTSLTDISLPSLPVIGYGAFSYCSALTNVDLPNATAVDREAFSQCTALESVEMENVTSIGILAFAGCTNLTTVDIPNATTIGMYAFSDCNLSTSIELSSVTSVGIGAFYGTGPTTIGLPNATTISYGAFQDCTALESVEIPNATSIGQAVFSGCVVLDSLTLGSVPPTVDATYSSPDEYVFYGLPSERFVHVSDDSVNTYKAFDDGDSPASDLWYGWYVYEPMTESTAPVTTPSSSSSGTRASVSQGQPPEIVDSTVSTLLRVTGDTKIEYDLSGGDTPVLGISFNAKKDKGLVVAKVQVLSDSPEGISLPAGNSYQLMSIDVGSEGTISTDSADNVLIHFRVSREWIEENNIDVSTIRMTRYHEQWQDLPTTYEREDDEFIYFTAQTSGFSIFSVVGNKIEETPIQETYASASPAEESQIESEDVEVKDTPGFTALAGIVFVALAFLTGRKLVNK